MIDDRSLWIVIVALGIGTFLFRFSFLGFVRADGLSPLVLRLLRYTPVAVLPGLVAPSILWPPATGGDPDPARLAAAFVTLTVGVATRNVLASVVAGGLTLAAGLFIGTVS